MAAPHYVAPIVGWRGWFVVEAAGDARSSTTRSGRRGTS
jgi:hypothetical protein